mmetsp:Transcript_2482/g.8212  ORF Transcript_2482/g.8212 Transcript_2482/m.8212 type:complete len:204 (-) Transcript_2482:271-882(-)
MPPGGASAPPSPPARSRTAARMLSSTRSLISLRRTTSEVGSAAKHSARRRAQAWSYWSLSFTVRAAAASTAKRRGAAGARAGSSRAAERPRRSRPWNTDASWCRKLIMASSLSVARARSRARWAASRETNRAACSACRRRTSPARPATGPVPRTARELFARAWPASRATSNRPRYTPSPSSVPSSTAMRSGSRPRSPRRDGGA